jgi:two-component system sensor histidine kinase DesK
MTQPADARGRRGGRIGVAFAAVWLVFLGQPASDLFQHPHPVWARVLGSVLLAAFVLIYLVGIGAPFRYEQRQRLWPLPIILLAIAVALLPLCGESGLNAVVFVAVAAQAALPVRLAIGACLALIAGSVVLVLVVPGWTDPGNIAFSILAASMAMFGVVRMADRNRSLVAAQAEQARLILLEERERMARDLHDILGHSLTVITKKAELARRLTAIDPERAALEIADVERLSREALKDIRATVSGSRQVTLAGELESARSALASAGIRADLPSVAVGVPPQYDRLFGFALREAVTNVLRHSGASSCCVAITASSVEIRDDGSGAGCEEAEGAGNGLLGLRARVADAGGRVVTDAPAGGGFRLLVDMATSNDTALAGLS